MEKDYNIKLIMNHWVENEHKFVTKLSIRDSHADKTRDPTDIEITVFELTIL